MKKSILDVAHSMAKALYDIGEIDSVTMRDFDRRCLPPVKSFRVTK